MGYFGVVVGYREIGLNKIYNVVALNEHEAGKYSFTGKFTGDATEIVSQFIANFGRIDLLNGDTLRDRGGYALKSKGYDYKCFSSLQAYPSVILNSIRHTNGTLLGYTILNLVMVNRQLNFKIVNVTAENALKLAKQFRDKNFKAYQNAMYIQDSDGSAFLRGHGAPLKEVTMGKKVANTDRYKSNTADVEKAEKGLSGADKKQENPFTKEQLTVLKKAKNDGIDFKRFANPKITANKMEVLYNIEKAGFDSRYLASPDFTLEALKFYLTDIKNGADIRGYINPKYNIAQLMELSSGAAAGVDYTLYADPNIYAEEMQEILLRLENDVWKDLTETMVFDDLTNKKLREEIKSRQASGKADASFVRRAEEVIDKRNEEKKVRSRKKRNK